MTDRDPSFPHYDRLTRDDGRSVHPPHRKVETVEQMARDLGIPRWKVVRLVTECDHDEKIPTADTAATLAIAPESPGVSI